jgi:hypothetical protein
VRAVGLEPSQALQPNGFSYPATAFAARSGAFRRESGFGVWTIPSPCPGSAPGFRCCPSSLYTFPAGKTFRPVGLARDRPIKGFPRS